MVIWWHEEGGEAIKILECVLSVHLLLLLVVGAFSFLWVLSYCRIGLIRMCIHSVIHTPVTTHEHSHGHITYIHAPDPNCQTPTHTDTGTLTHAFNHENVQNTRSWCVCVLECLLVRYGCVLRQGVWYKWGKRLMDISVWCIIWIT